MKKHLAIGFLLVVWGILGGCGRAISTEEFRILEKQVAGTLILDAFERATRDGIPWEGAANTIAACFPRDTLKVDSLAKVAIEKAVPSRGYTPLAFYKKAKELDANPVKGIRLNVISAVDTLTAQITRGAIGLVFANMGASDEELSTLLEGFIWMRVDSLCRRMGYLPLDYEERMKQYHWPGGKPPREQK